MFLKRILGIRIVAGCGHKTKFKDKVTAFGETIITSINPRSGKVDYCHECLGKMAIQCAWCAKAIFVGDSITLYSPKDTTEIKVPDYAVIFDEKLLQLVGCGRSSCASTGADYAGFWIPGENGKGEVNRTPTMIEQSLISMSLGGDGIVINSY